MAKRIAYEDGAILQALSQGLARYKDVASMTLATPNIYGRNSIFDPCAAGDVFGMQVQTSGIMQWIGWRSNKYYSRRVDIIPWWGPSGTAAGSPSSAAGAPCNDPNGWEHGHVSYQMLHTSWYQRGTEGLDPFSVTQERCETSPRYRLDGQIIKDDVEWQMNGIQNVLQQDIRHDLVHGSHLNAYEMNGLESIIKAGYVDDNGVAIPVVDSNMIAWANDDLSGSVNGFGNFFDYLDELVTEIEWRAQNRGVIAMQDMVLFTTRFVATGLLDAYACYTTCGSVSADTSDLALRKQQRDARMELNAGPLYDGTSAVGYIPLKSGRKLPVLVDDAFDITKGGTNKWVSDIYLLTRRIGSMDVLYGEYLDMNEYANRVKAQAPSFTVRADPSGRFALKSKEKNFCVELIMGTSPELYLSAPWAQARISNVAVSRVRQPLTGDPHQPTYMVGRPLHKATGYGS